MYRELVTLVGNGRVYGLMRDAKALCEVICRDLRVTQTGARYRLSCPSRHQLAQPPTAVTVVREADRPLVDDRFETISRQDVTTTYDSSDQLSDVGRWSTTPAAGVIVIEPPDLTDDDDDDESLPSTMIANKVTNFNVNYDIPFKWQRRHYY